VSTLAIEHRLGKVVFGPITVRLPDESIMCRDVVTWRVGNQSFEIALADIFRRS
jgi:hypothetical protein